MEGDGGERERERERERVRIIEEGGSIERWNTIHSYQSLLTIAVRVQNMTFNLCPK